MKIKFIFILIITSIFLSCSSRPPENIETISFLEMIRATINKIREIKDSKEQFRNYMEESGKEDSLSALYKGDTIVFHDLKREHSPDALVYSYGAGLIIINENMYISRNNKGDFIFSPDNENWYLENNDRKKGIENIDFHFDIESEFTDDKTLFIEFSWEAGMGSNPKRENIRNREPVLLEEGQIFDHSVKKMININFKKQSLFIPAGTILEGRFELNGNLVNSTIDNTDIVVRAEKDLYIYTGDKRAGLSFDNENWNISIFSFKIKSENKIISTGDSKILIYNALEVQYR